MSFSFKEKNFTSLFENITDIARSVVTNSQEYESDIVSLARYHLNICTIFEIGNSALDLDSLIKFSRSKFNYVDLLSTHIQNSESLKDSIILKEILSLNISLLFIYLSEMNFRVDRKESTTRIKIDGFIDRSREILNTLHPDYINFAEQRLAYEILKEKINFLDIEKYENIKKEANNFEKIIKQWEGDFSDKVRLVNELEKRVISNKQTYDFVLLNKGFKQLYDQKSVELDKTKNTYAFVAATMFVLPFFELSFLLGAFFYFDGNLPTTIWFFSIPFITMILITLYLVKISLQDKRSIQSQMMQLELRMALCQFIHNYADDSETLHQKNSAGFEKFENIIFSPLVSSDDKIPTTFDGMEQLAKLVSEFRK